MKFSTWENFNLEADENTIVVIADDLPLHKKLRVKRLIEGLTQQELAEILGLEFYVRISNIEKGKDPLENRSTPHHHLERIKKYLYEEDYRNGKLVESN
ncbi:helix-turn-helix domain-containing protein [Bacillus wiedmannii]|uniref:helix-turn-helix domain-containing protein n=1 Tax=Bacillus wiedmannii TaxID=1890302 RepID=UPI003D1CCF99